MTQFDLLTRSAPPAEPRRAAFDVDYTPRAIPRQVYEVLAPELGVVRRILCPAAGAGVWAMVAREFWPDAHITAVEIREEERDHLNRWCDGVNIGDTRDLAKYMEPGYDIIADNPPFSLFPVTGCDHVPRAKSPDRCGKCGARKGQAEALRAYVVSMRPLLARGGRLVLYWLSDLGQRGKEARAILAAHPPLYQMRTQPTRHRATGGADLRSYSVWVWPHGEPRTPEQIKHDTPPRWATFDLHSLPPAERRWSIVPGTERGEAPPLSDPNRETSETT